MRDKQTYDKTIAISSEDKLYVHTSEIKGKKNMVHTDAGKLSAIIRFYREYKEKKYDH